MKKIQNKKLEMILATIVELTEFLIMSIISIFVLHASVVNVLIVLFTFFISRFAIGEPGHYKIVNYFDGGWRRCFLWTSALILSLCLTIKLDVLVGVLFTVFSVFVISGKANIEDMKLGWKPRNEKSKYQDVIDFVKYNSLDDKLLEFETKIKNTNNLEYLIYKYKFKESKTFEEMSELLDMDGPRIVEKLDKIAFAIRLYCGI